MTGTAGMITAFSPEAIEGGLDPVKRLEEQRLNLEKQIRYTVDLTREYHNLPQKEEDRHIQTYLWDGNVIGLVEEEKEAQYYFQDDLGSPVRLADAEGNLIDSYGYDEFGRDLYGNKAVIQPQTINVYSYCWNNPIKWIDQNGEEPENNGETVIGPPDPNKTYTDIDGDPNLKKGTRQQKLRQCLS